MTGEGRPLTYEEFISSFGQRNDVILRGLLGPDLPEEEVARLSEIKEKRYRELVLIGGIDFLPGVKAWLLRLRSHRWRQAIVSSAPKKNIYTVLKVLKAGVLFNTIVSGKDVQKGKPDPQGFLMAAERLGVSPRRCIVVEDAPAGIEAAYCGGMLAVGVLTSHSSLKADCTVKTLSELNENTFEMLLELRNRT